ncbi:MAG TPA: hypothetical protein DCF87_02895, partial [Opitutae bacterium]|nr:hypothetical protein [Opitutae bacterium]
MKNSFIFLFLLSFGGVCAENWPAWRGADASGAVESGDYPAELNQNKNLLWKSPLPEKGCSTPIVWENSIFLTSPVDGEDSVLGFSRNGKQVWQTTIGPERKGRHLNGSGSNPSVVT